MKFVNKLETQERTTRAGTVKAHFTREETVYLDGIYNIQRKYLGTKLSYKQYKYLLASINDKVFNAMLEGYEHTLPAGLGKMQNNIVKCEMVSEGDIINKGRTTYPIDSAATRETVAAGKPQIIYDFTIDKVLKFRWYKHSFKNRAKYFLKLNHNIQLKLYKYAKYKLR